MLPRDKLTLESAIQVNLDNETVRLPLYLGIAYAGTPHQEKVWYILEDASDPGAAKDLGVNYAPKLANIALSCPACVQTVHLINPSPQDNHFGPAGISFAGAPDFSPTRIAVPGPDGFPLARFQPGAVAGPGYTPFIKIAGSDTIYNAPIVATGDGPFDVTTHTDTADRALAIHIAGPSAPGQFAEPWVDMLFIKGFDPRHRPARALRLGRRRRQLRGHRLHGPGTHRQPRGPGARLPVPAQVTREPCGPASRGPAGNATTAGPF